MGDGQKQEEDIHPSTQLPLDQGTGGGWSCRVPLPYVRWHSCACSPTNSDCCVLSICSRVAREHQVAELCRRLIREQKRRPTQQPSWLAGSSRFRRRLQSVRPCWLEVAPVHHHQG